VWVAGGRRILLHDPTHVDGRRVRHWDGPMAGSVILHVVSVPSGLPVTIDKEVFAVGTTPFDLYVDLDGPGFMLATKIGNQPVRVMVSPDRDQVIELTAAPERSR
jgi:hypothetical protein